jgi:PhnB protein
MGQPGFRRVSLSLKGPDTATAEWALAVLADGEHTQMPLARIFWSPRFGVGWMVSVAA